MGMYDEVHIHRQVAQDYNLICKKCKKPLEKFQTKDLDCSINDFLLNYDKDKNLKLYKICVPKKTKKSKFFHSYTAKEVEDIRLKQLQRTYDWFMWAIDDDVQDGGILMPEAWHMKNRRKVLIKGFPHCICRLYGTCECSKNSHLDIEIKFTDGIVQYVKKLT